MEYKQLEFFLAVCEQNSFRRAAETCFVSQQAISKSLANLEQELGVQLFVRSSDGVTLTEAGRLLEQQVRPHLNERNEILLRLRQFHAQPQLRIGYFMGFLQELPPHFFSAFQQQHPEVQLHFHSYTDNERSRNYRNYDCDLVITTSPLNSSDFVRLAHFESDIGVILSRQNPLAQKHSLTLADLKEVPLITLNTENRSQAQLMERLQNMGLTIDSVLGDADWELVFGSATAGLCFFLRRKSQHTACRHLLLSLTKSAAPVGVFHLWQTQSPHFRRAAGADPPDHGGSIYQRTRLTLPA